jgi:hypothetical protein
VNGFILPFLIPCFSYNVKQTKVLCISLVFYLIAYVLALALQGPKCRNLSKLIHVQQRISKALMSASKSRHTLPHIPVLATFQLYSDSTVSTHPATSFSDEHIYGCVSELGHPEQVMGDQVSDQKGAAKRKKEPINRKKAESAIPGLFSMQGQGLKKL